MGAKNVTFTGGSEPRKGRRPRCQSTDHATCRHHHWAAEEPWGPRTGWGRVIPGALDRLGWGWSPGPWSGWGERGCPWGHLSTSCGPCVGGPSGGLLRCFRCSRGALTPWLGSGTLGDGSRGTHNLTMLAKEASGRVLGSDLPAPAGGVAVESRGEWATASLSPGWLQRVRARGSPRHQPGTPSVAALTPSPAALTHLSPPRPVWEHLRLAAGSPCSLGSPPLRVPTA